MLFESQIIQAAASDPKAFSKLYQHYLQPSYAFIAFRVNSLVDAEDLTSELWIKVLTHLQTLESNKPEVFRAWLYTTARRLIIDFYRRRKTTLSLEENNASANPNEPSKLIIESDLIRQLIKNLPEQQAEIVSLKYFSGLRNKEIAKLMELSEKTIASHLSRAHQNLKKGLQHHTSL